MKRTAIVLFNLGGPDRPAAVKPFLFNLFNDPAIIGAPQPIRFLLAKLISSRRAPVAAEIYHQIGGGSPLLSNTEAQARAIEAAIGDGTVKAFIAMRYWHPLAAATASAVKAFAPERIVLMPLYPQYSTTTTGSSLADWRRAARAAGLATDDTTVCCYPTMNGFTDAVAELTRPALARAAAHGRPRVLFSAHGLPKRVVAKGDPYQWQVEQSAATVAQRLALNDSDWLVSYQSRVGPLEWISPYTDEEIRRAGRERVPLVVVPIAFVSEHSETLVELDIEYRKLAAEAGVPAYERVATVGTAPAFITGLARLVEQAIAAGPGLRSDRGGRLCPANWGRCACVGQVG